MRFVGAQQQVGERAMLVQLPRVGCGVGKEHRGGVQATREMHIHVEDSREGLPELLVDIGALSRKRRGLRRRLRLQYGSVNDSLYLSIPRKIENMILPYPTRLKNLVSPPVPQCIATPCRY